MIKLVQNSHSAPQLPTPSKEEFENSQLLTQEIIKNIQLNDNWLSFCNYMDMALYHPNYGYYTSGTRKIGYDGDFITAPELGSLFAFSLANQMRPILTNHPHYNILEFGAGSGKLCLNLLLELDKTFNLPGYYYILEVSAELKDRQQKELTALPLHIKNKIIWLDTLPQDNSFQGIIIANEVLDAMPVNLFNIDNDGICELGLSVINNQIIWQTKPADIVLCNYLETHIIPVLKQNNAKYPYLSEVNLLAKDWLCSVSQCLNQGIILLIDYGFNSSQYYHHDRNQGTLMCHYKHYAHQDPLLYPGIQDITAHVDFTSLAQTAIENDLEISVYLDQAHFLLANNITSYIDDNKNKQEIFKLKQDLKILTNPSEMGELFKVMILNKNVDHTFFEYLQSFDRRYCL